MVSESKKLRAQQQVDSARKAKRDWISGLITDHELKKVLDCCCYSTISSAGLHDAFDRIAEVNCAREWLNASSICGDDPSVLRSYAVQEWERLSQQNPLGSIDLFGVLVPLDIV